MNPLIARLVAVFGEPDAPDPTAFLAELDRALDQLPMERLTAAGDRLLKTYRGRTFPAIGTVLSAVDDVTPPPMPSQGPRYAEWSPERMALADKLIQCEMGRKAAREGWILSLHDYCRNHGHLPEYTEIHEVIAKARGFDDAYSECAAGRGGKLNDALLRLGNVFLEKRNKYAAIAMGERD